MSLRHLNIGIVGRMSKALSAAIDNSDGGRRYAFPPYSSDAGAKALEEKAMSRDMLATLIVDRSHA